MLAGVNAFDGNDDRRKKPRVKWTTEVEKKFIDIRADILEELDKKVPLQVLTPLMQAALLACKECDTVQSIQPHARGDIVVSELVHTEARRYFIQGSCSI